MTSKFTDEDLLKALRRGAKILGEPLSVVQYQKVAAQHRLPSHMTIIVRFGTWGVACELAGVEANKAQGERGTSITREQCVEAMIDCCDDIGGRPSYESYAKWARANGRPSGPTVRVKWGTWGKAAKVAFK